MLCLALLAGCGMPEVVKDSYEYVTSLFDKGDSSLRKRLVVVPFHSGIKGLNARAMALSKILVSRLPGQGNLVLVKLETLQKEMDKIGARIRDPQERMLVAGRRLGINTILTGRITDLSVSYRFKGVYGFRDNTPFLGLEFDLSLYDVTTGTLLSQTSKRQELALTDMESENIKLGKAPPVKKVDELAAISVEPNSGLGGESDFSTGLERRDSGRGKRQDQGARGPGYWFAVGCGAHCLRPRRADHHRGRPAPLSAGQAAGQDRTAEVGDPHLLGRAPAR